MTVEEFLDALSHATAGEWVVYHTGNLAEAADCSRRGLALNPLAPNVAAVREMAWKVGAPQRFITKTNLGHLDIGGFGAADLFQKRVSRDACDYGLKMRRALTLSELAIVKMVGVQTLLDITNPRERKKAA
jgi:hypothetical protein